MKSEEISALAEEITRCSAGKVGFSVYYGLGDASDEATLQVDVRHLKSDEIQVIRDALLDTLAGWMTVAEGVEVEASASAEVAANPTRVHLHTGGQLFESDDIRVRMHRTGSDGHTAAYERVPSVEDAAQGILRVDIPEVTPGETITLQPLVMRWPAVQQDGGFVQGRLVTLRVDAEGVLRRG